MTRASTWNGWKSCSCRSPEPPAAAASRSRQPQPAAGKPAATNGSRTGRPFRSGLQSLAAHPRPHTLGGMRRLLVLGAGTAGTMVVNKLRHRLDPADWDITVVDQHDRHYYQPGYLFIPFGT